MPMVAIPPFALKAAIIVTVVLTIPTLHQLISGLTVGYVCGFT